MEVLNRPKSRTIIAMYQKYYLNISLESIMFTHTFHSMSIQIKFVSNVCIHFCDIVKREMWYLVDSILML